MTFMPSLTSKAGRLQGRARGESLDHTCDSNRRSMRGGSKTRCSYRRSATSINNSPAGFDRSTVTVIVTCLDDVIMGTDEFDCATKSSRTFGSPMDRRGIDDQYADVVAGPREPVRCCHRVEQQVESRVDRRVSMQYIALDPTRTSRHVCTAA